MKGFTRSFKPNGRLIARGSRRGSALLIVLGMLAFMVISAVAFSAYMRYSRLPSSYLRRASSSRLLVKAALAEAIDQVDAAIGENLHPNVGKRQPRMGVGGVSADLNGIQNEDLNNRNVWLHRVYMGTNNVSNLLSPEDTVSTLTLEGLAYIPPPLINYARYYSRRSRAANWRNLGFDAGRYAFCAIDVSDYLDVNVLAANHGRGATPATRISLAYLFEKRPDHDSYNFNPSDWDEFLRLFWKQTAAEATIGSFDAAGQRADNSHVPLVSVADLNLAMWNKFNSGGPFKNPFCNYVENNKGLMYDGARYNDRMDCTEEGELIHRMTFVTDGYFPHDQTTESYDITKEENQPFTLDLLDQSSVAYGTVKNGSSATGTRLRERISGLGMAMLYDYLDSDNIPVSLSIPSVERIPMIAAIQPSFQNSKVAFKAPEQGQMLVSPGNANAIPATKIAQTITIQQATTYRLDSNFAAPGSVKVVATYPFRRGRDLKKESQFKIDGLVELFFTSGNMRFRPGSGDGYLRLDTTKTPLEPATACDGVFCIKLDEQDFRPTNVNPQSEDDSSVIKEMTFTTMGSAGTLASQVNSRPFMTVVEEYTMEWIPNESSPNGGSYGSPSEKRIVARMNDGSAETRCGIVPLTEEGVADTDFTLPNKMAAWLDGGNRTLTLQMAVWIRVRNSDGKVVDLVPASMTDDRTATGQNDENNHSMGPEGAVQLGNNNPLMRFTGSGVTIARTGPAPAGDGTFGLSPSAVMCPDPRWNWAPEHWFSCADASSANWLQNCGRGRNDGCDRDIFMATSDAGYLQSVYELAFIPRITDSSGDRLASNGQFGNIETPNDNRETWATDINGVRNNNLMWTTYRPYQRGGMIRDPLEEIGLVSEGGGYKINPYSDETNVVMAAFANTPLDWWAAASAALDGDSWISSSERKDAKTFNKKYAFNAMNEDARFAWEDLENIAGSFMDRIHGSGGLRDQTETDVNIWEDIWDGVSGNGISNPLNWNEDQDHLFGVTLTEETDALFDVDRKFLYGYWRDCFAPRQQLFLIFVRAEPQMMGGGGQTPPQLGARAVALVWRDPISTGDSTKPHRTRVLFYRQLD